MLLFTFSNKVYSQKYNLPVNNFYKTAKISLNDFKKYDGFQVMISKDSIDFRNKETNENIKLSLSQVNYIRVKSGNESAKWALYGGLFTGITSVLAVMQVESDPDRKLKDNAGTIIAGFVASGIVVGGLIGLTIPKWKTYYVNNGISIIKIKPDLCLSNNSINIRLRFTFN